MEKAIQNANQQTVMAIGDFVDALFSELNPLPISATAKQAMVSTMVGDCIERKGDIITFRPIPPA
jgi:hypothetical protein